MTNTIFIWRRHNIHVSMQLKLNYAKHGPSYYISMPPFTRGRHLFHHYMGSRKLMDDIVLLGETSQHASVKGLSNRLIARWWRDLIEGRLSYKNSRFDNIAIITEALYIGCKRKIQRPFVFFNPGEHSKENALTELLKYIDQINEASFGKKDSFGNAT